MDVVGDSGSRGPSEEQQLALEEGQRVALPCRWHLATTKFQPQSCALWRSEASPMQPEPGLALGLLRMPFVAGGGELKRQGRKPRGDREASLTAVRRCGGLPGRHVGVEVDVPATTSELCM